MKFHLHSWNWLARDICVQFFFNLYILQCVNPSWKWNLHSSNYIVYQSRYLHFVHFLWFLFFTVSQPSLNDNHALHRSVSSGSLYSVQSADLRLASEAGPMFSPSAGLSGEALSGSFTGSLDSFMTGSTNKISSLGRTASQSDNEIDQAAKRSRSK